ncbi:hypothetical protein CL634_00025 [bacterium]|nr:hypothetical protein [bacterium]|tara:strand:+ start:554 stop:1786 length:1233 start_codon:yes stop_codon:yes gene_type:complete
MADYNRIYWAIQALGIAREGSHNGALVHATGAGDVANLRHSIFTPGVQSVGITTTFNLEQVFEMGQLSIYQDVEEVPDVEVTIERVIDSFCLLYSRCADFNASADVANGGPSIPSMQNHKVDLWFTLTKDNVDNAGDATPTNVVWMSGMYMSSASFNFATDGNLTESITMVGNHKKWLGAMSGGGGATDQWMQGVPSADVTTANTSKDGLEVGRIQRRQNVRLYTQDTDAATLSNAHRDLSGMTGAFATVDTQPTIANEAKIMSATVSVDFGREQINVLGQKLPYFRYVTFPVEVTCEIEILAQGADNVDALPEAANLTERRIEFFIEPIEELKSPIETFDNTAGGDTASADAIAHFNLGSKNKLTSVTWGGGDTGGANAMVTYSYRNFNDLRITSHKPDWNAATPELDN